MVSALAPASDVVTWMVGKSTCGNGATGRNGKAAMPTKAKADINRQVAIGRRMNGSGKFKWGSPRGRARGGGDSPRRVGLQLVLSVGPHAVTVVQARNDDRRIAGSRPDLDLTSRRDVVGAHDPRVQSLRPALDRDRRRRDDVAARLQLEPGVDELARPQPVVRIGEHGLEPDRGGRR